MNNPLKLLFALTLCSVPVFTFAESWSHTESRCSQTDVIFCTGFEEASWRDNWDDYDGNPESTNSVHSIPGPLNHPDNKAMRLRVPTGRGNADTIKVLPSSHQKLYARWYQYWEPGYDFSALNHGSGLHAGDRSRLGRSGIRPESDEYYSTWIEPYNSRLNLYTYYRGMYQDCADPNGSCWGDHLPCTMDEGSGYCTKPEHRETVMPPVMETGQWYCIEVMLDGGTPSSSDAQADGKANFWIDNTAYGPWENLWLRSEESLKVNILWLSIFHHDEHSVEGAYFDNVVVSTNRVGCLSTDIEPANAAPNPPHNVNLSRDNN